MLGGGKIRKALVKKTELSIQKKKNYRRHPPMEERKKKIMSEVGFEPTPTRVDCDLNAAP